MNFLLHLECKIKYVKSWQLSLLSNNGEIIFDDKEGNLSVMMQRLERNATRYVFMNSMPN